MGGAGKNKSEVQHLKDLVRQLKAQNEEHEQKKKELKEKSDDLRLERHQKYLEIKELEASKHGLEELVAGLQGNFNNVAQNSKTGKDESDALHMENRKLQDMISTMGGKTANEYAQLLKEKAEFQQKISSVVGTSEDPKKENEALTRKIKDLERKVSKLDNNSRYFYNLSEEFKNNNNELSQKNKDLEDKMSSAENNHRYYYSLSEKNNHELSRKNKKMEAKISSLEQNPSEEPKDNDELTRKNKELEQKVSSLELNHHDLSEEHKKEIEELSQKNMELEERVITLAAENQHLEHTKQLCEERYEGKQNKVRELNLRLVKQQPLVKLALDVRQKFWQQAKEELGLGIADRSLIQAGEVASNRPNCQVDAALLSLGSQQSPLVSSPYGFIGAVDFKMSPESFQTFYVAAHTDGIFETWHHLDIELTNVFTYSNLCLAKSNGRRELEEIDERIVYLGRNVISNGFSVLVQSGTIFEIQDWDGTWFKTPDGCDAETSAAFDGIRAAMIEMREALESLVMKATWGECLL